MEALRELIYKAASEAVSTLEEIKADIAKLRAISAGPKKPAVFSAAYAAPLAVSSCWPGAIHEQRARAAEQDEAEGKKVEDAQKAKTLQGLIERVVSNYVTREVEALEAQATLLIQAGYDVSELTRIEWQDRKYPPCIVPKVCVAQIQHAARQIALDAVAGYAGVKLPTEQKIG
jgi:hypothetical protein